MLAIPSYSYISPEDYLKGYVLVSQTRKNVECFRRNAEGHWVLYPALLNLGMKIENSNSQSLTL